jgi:hypothetical protein
MAIPASPSPTPSLTQSDISAHYQQAQEDRDSAAVHSVFVGMTAGVVAILALTILALHLGLSANTSPLIQGVAIVGVAAASVGIAYGSAHLYLKNRLRAIRDRPITPLSERATPVIELRERSSEGSLRRPLLQMHRPIPMRGSSAESDRA